MHKKFYLLFDAFLTSSKAHVLWSFSCVKSSHPPGSNWQACGWLSVQRPRLRPLGQPNTIQTLPYRNFRRSMIFYYFKNFSSADFHVDFNKLALDSRRQLENIENLIWNSISIQIEHTLGYGKCHRDLKSFSYRVDCSTTDRLSKKPNIITIECLWFELLSLDTFPIQKLSTPSWSSLQAAYSVDSGSWPMSWVHCLKGRTTSVVHTIECNVRIKTFLMK